MTTGDKIQFYRKKLGMSQEELGQKLFVSRQTVSLWENGQTVPTIDNLLRLKEIFGVSIDEILSPGEVSEENIPEEIQAAEKYTFGFSQSEASEICGIFTKKLIKNFIIFFLACAFLLITSANADTYIFFDIFLGVFFVGVIGYIKTALNLRKTNKRSRKTLTECAFEIEAYDGYFISNVYRDNEQTIMARYSFSDEMKAVETGKYLLFVISGRMIVFKKSELPQASVFYRQRAKLGVKPSPKTQNSGYRVLSIILFAASLLSVFPAMFLVALASEINHLFTENMWLFFLMTPVPIASIVFGVILKRKGYKYKKNIIVGLIMTAVLCLYGSFSFIFYNTFNHSDKYIARAEEYIGIDIPEHKTINTTDREDGWKFTSTKEYVYYKSDVYFEQKSVEEFENDISDNEKWLSSLSNALTGIISFYDNYATGYDYILIYNIDTDEFNKLPSESGTYRFITITYNEKDNYMRITEYSIDYEK